MPVFEATCCGRVKEFYTSHHANPNPKCEACGEEMKRMLSTFATPFTGTLDRYDKAGCKTNMPAPGGHFAYRVNSSRLADGRPERVLISTRQEQLAYVRAEGLMDPMEVNANMEVGPDGMHPNTQGMPSSWTGAPSSFPQGESPMGETEKNDMGGVW